MTAATLNRVPMTTGGAQQLRDELEHLKRVERPKITKDIAEARAHGDLKENAEYHAAREQQGFVEARVKDIESKLSHAHVIDVSKLAQTRRVVFGATVTLVNVDTDEEVVYKIVGEDEASIEEKKISVTSPIARAVIGKEAGDYVDVNTPQGEVEYEIAEVEYI